MTFFIKYFSNNLPCRSFTCSVVFFNICEPSPIAERKEEDFVRIPKVFFEIKDGTDFETIWYSLRFCNEADCISWVVVVIVGKLKLSEREVKQC